MSYILDALRKAEAERQRGQVPGLHASPPPGMPAAHEPADTAAVRRRFLPLGAAAVGVLAVAAAVWLVGGRDTPGADASVPEGAAAPVAPPPVTASPPVPAQPLPQVVTASPAPAPAAAPAPSPSPAPSTAQAQPQPLQAQAQAQAQAPAVAVPPPAAAPVSAPPVRPLRFTELPADQRSQFPSLMVGGSVWSDSAAQRFIILNGQVVREGETVSPGLVLERLLPRAAWLRWRGLLVEIPY